MDVGGPNIRRGAPASLPDHLPDSAWAAHRQKTARRASGLEARLSVSVSVSVSLSLSLSMSLARAGTQRQSEARQGTARQGDARGVHCNHGIVWPSGYRQDGPHVSRMHQWVMHNRRERSMELTLLARCIHVSSLE
jgi:hypothetical protein